MGEFETFLKVLLVICAGVVTIWGCVKVVFELRNLVCKSSDDLMKTVAQLKEAKEAHARMLDRDKRRIDSMEKASNLNLKAQMQLLQHTIHGNHLDAMQETLDEIEEYLINR